VALGRRSFLKLLGWGVGLGVLAHHRPGLHHGPTTTTTTTTAPPPGGSGLYHDSYAIY
jgi:hypothetical protein